MTYRREIEMYPSVMEWLGSFLRSRFRPARIDVRDTHMSPLNEYIRRQGLGEYFDSDLWQTFDIRVDVTGFVRTSRVRGVAFVECKTTPISLRHLSQLLGYSRVAMPLVSYLISPAGVGSNLKSLVLRYDRSDILEYTWMRGKSPRTVILGRWDPLAKTLDATSLLPPGALT